MYNLAATLKPTEYILHVMLLSQLLDVRKYKSIFPQSFVGKFTLRKRGRGQILTGSNQDFKIGSKAFFSPSTRGLEMKPSVFRKNIMPRVKVVKIC